MRVCCRCGKKKPAKDFASSARKSCEACLVRQRHANRAGRSRRGDSEYLRDIHLRSKYGITLEEYETLRWAQNYRCAICDTHEDNLPQRKVSGKPRSDGKPKTLPVKLVVDHCHGTGKVRGLLCNSCNVGLGVFRDDPLRLEGALKYLANDGCT